MLHNDAKNGMTGYPIRVVSQRTGLTTPVIRAWERRYGTVMPARSEGGQRVYSEADLARLQLLATLVGAGRGIGSIAELSTESLEALVDEELAAGPSSHQSFQPAIQQLVEQALVLVETLKPDELERLLMRAAVTYRTKELVDGVLVPLLREIGSAWQTGQFGPSSEHVASLTIRKFLEWLSTTVQVQAEAPLLVTGTPSGQRHEFGALLAGLIGADEAWRVRFLGPDLPGVEIGKAVRSFGASAVALSAIYPAMGEAAVEDVISIRESLPDRIDLIIGGPASDAHSARWTEAGILWYPSLDEYRAGLVRIRTVRFGSLIP